MYCTQCGTQLSEGVKYCYNCGIKLPLENSVKKSKDITVELKGGTQILSAKSKKVSFSLSKKAIGWYLTWVFAHLFLLLIIADSIIDSSKSNSLDDFWPIGGIYGCTYCGFAHDYDITEFIVYTSFPLAFLYIRSLIRSKP